MLQVLVFAFLASSSAFTTHRYETYDSYVNYRPIAPQPRNNFAYQNANGRRQEQLNQYPKRDTEFNQDAVSINSDSVVRWTEYPYQRENKQDDWNRIAEVEAIKFSNRLRNSNLDVKYPTEYINTYDRRQVVNQNKQELVVKQINGTYMNEAQGNKNKTPISKQSDDVNHSLIISEQQITRNNDYRKRNQSPTENNTNTTKRRSINSNNNTNLLFTINNKNGSITLNSIKFNSNSNNSNLMNSTTSDKTYRPIKIYNNFIVNTNNYHTTHNNTDQNAHNKTVIVFINKNTSKNNTDVRSKTIQDNEVTQRPLDGRNNKDSDTDRWIWSNSEDQKVESTTLFDLDNRDAFKANECPIGKIKIGKICVEID